MHPHLIHCAIGALISAAVAVYALSRSERDTARRLVIALVSVLFVWNCAMAIRRLAVGQPDDHLAFAVYLAAGVAIPPLWLLVAAHLTRSGLVWRWSLRRCVLLLGLPALLFYTSAMTSDLHSLHFRSGGPGQIEAPLSRVAGPTLWLSAAWSYALVIIGMCLYLRRAIELARLRGQWLRAIALGSATLVPLAVALANSFGAFGPNAGITQSSAALSLAVIFILSWRYRLRETLPVARRDVIDHLFDGVVISDAEGCVLDLNPAAERMFGAGPRQLRGTPAMKLFTRMSPDDSGAQFRGLASDIASSRGPWFHSFRDRDGRLFEVTTAPLRTEGETPAGYFVVIRDQTERRRLERLLRQSQRLETVSGLAAGIAHEVNNPLAYVRSNLSHIERLTADLGKRLDAGEQVDAPALAEVGEVALESIDGIDRIAGIVERLRRFSRVDGDDLEMIDLNEALRDALRLADLDRSESVELRTDFASDLPKIPGSLDHVVQALLSVVLHAKHSVANRPDGVLRISTSSADGLAEILVEDNGPGISAVDRSQLLNPVSHGEDVPENTLGLSIAFGIIREHYGVLELEGSPDSGTRFQIRFPVKLKDADALSGNRTEPAS